MTDTFHPGESQGPSVLLMSQNGQVALDFRGGNLTLREHFDLHNGGKGHVYWNAGVGGKGKLASLLQNGNFQVTDANGVILWQTHTGVSGSVPFVLHLQNDHNLVLWDPRGKGSVVWAASKGGFPTHASLLGIHVKVADVLTLGATALVRKVDPNANQWINNAIRTAGRAIDHVAVEIQDESGRISKALDKIPIVGGLLGAIYDVGFQSVLGPLLMTEEVVVEGKGIDKVVLASLKAGLADFKEIGPYAEMVCSLIPGVGQGIAAAIGCGLALANGQPLSQALLAGVEGALPGGPLAKMAFQVADDTLTSVIAGKPVGWKDLVDEGISAAAAAISLPDVAKDALNGGFQCCAEIIQGKPLDRALVDGLATGLPIPPEAKKAMGDITDMANAIAKGEPVTKALLIEVDKVAAYLPVSGAIKQGITGGLDAATGLVQGKPIGQVLAITITHTVTDIFLDTGKAHLPIPACNAINISIASKQGSYKQQLVTPQLQGPVTHKLMNQGQGIVKTDPVSAAAYSTVPAANQHGFQVGLALMRTQASVHELLTIRQGLSPADQVGFDMAVSLHAARVANPPPKDVGDIKAAAGFYMVKGMQGGLANQKQAQMAIIAQHPIARLGATVAVNHIVAARTSWWNQLLTWLGFKEAA
jgi:hypothetical protein